jgi:hypothetical protein
MKALTFNELKLDKYNNPLYIVSYVNADGEVGVDYTFNLAELLTLLDYHAKNSDSYVINRIDKGD